MIGRFCCALLAAVSVGVPSQAGFSTFTNPNPITINDGANATPYPVPIVVSGVDGNLLDMSLTLYGFNHSFPNDVGILLVNPAGNAGIVIFDGGTTVTITNADLTFTDGAPAWPGGGPVGTGTFSPFSFFNNTGWGAPAPSLPGVNPDVQGTYSFLNTFTTADINGTWNLYIADFVGVDSGFISGGVSLSFATTPVPPTVFALGFGLLGLLGVRRTRKA